MASLHEIDESLFDKDLNYFPQVDADFIMVPSICGLNEDNKFYYLLILINISIIFNLKIFDIIEINLI